MNKLIYCLLVIAASACIPSQQPPANYAVDNLWCWHKEQEQWRVKGAASTCPVNTVYWNSK